MTAPNIERPMHETPVIETVASTPRKALNPMLKFALELGPLALFFIAYGRLGIFAATGVLMASVSGRRAPAIAVRITTGERPAVAQDGTATAPARARENDRRVIRWAWIRTLFACALQPTACAAPPPFSYEFRR